MGIKFLIFRLQFAETRLNSACCRQRRAGTLKGPPSRSNFFLSYHCHHIFLPSAFFSGSFVETLLFAYH